MNKTVLVESIINQIDIRYVEEALEPSSVPQASSVRSLIQKPVYLAAAALVVCLVIGGAVFAGIRNKLITGPNDPDIISESTHETPLAERRFRCEVLSLANGGPFSPFLTQSDLAVQWGSGLFQSQTAAKEITVTFEGTAYHGVYSYSYVPSGLGVTHDVYKPEIPAEGDYNYFEVNSSTGDLVFIHLASPRLLLEEKEASFISQEEIDEIAKQWAAKWIPLDEYEKEVEFRDTQDDDWDFYAYRFWSKVNGVETTDYVSVMVSNKGRLIYIGASQAGWSREHRAELEAFPVEEAILKGIEASGFVSPTINVKRLGITSENEIVLLLGLNGTEEEGAVLFVIRRED